MESIVSMGSYKKMSVRGWVKIREERETTKKIHHHLRIARWWRQAWHPPVVGKHQTLCRCVFYHSVSALSHTSWQLIWQFFSKVHDLLCRCQSGGRCLDGSLRGSQAPSSNELYMTSGHNWLRHIRGADCASSDPPSPSHVALLQSAIAGQTPHCGSERSCLLRTALWRTASGLRQLF